MILKSSRNFYWQNKRFAISILALCALLLVAVQARGDKSHPTVSGIVRAVTDGNILYFPLPPDVSRQDLLYNDEKLKIRLHGLVSKHLTSQNISQRVTGDLIIIYSDHEGQVILPDLEAVKSPTGIKGSARNELTFTYDSPDYPWSDEELAVLNAASQDFYPIIREVYGDPAFSTTVNVRKDPSLVFPGDYSPTTNEIVLRSTSQLDVFCHEMIHAFRDGDIIMLSSYEEGMTVAAEVEVLGRLRDFAFWDDHHSYPYDVYYDGLNKQIIGPLHGFFDNKSPLLLLDYQLAGYAWAKVFFENPDFFVDFNKELYSRSLSDSTVRSTESKLLGITTELQSVVEGKPFLSWYGQQGIFNTDPPSGYFLYQNISNFTIYYFHRDLKGIESFQPDALIQWAAYDFKNDLLDSGSDRTSSLGWISINPTFPVDYRGRIKVVASVSTPEGVLIDTAMRSIGNEEGVFGVVGGAASGSLTITPIDENTSPVSISVINGSFSAPSLTIPKGRFVAVFTDPEGRVFWKEFTKDASNYFLLIGANASILVEGVEQLVIEVNHLVTADILNDGQGTALTAILEAAIRQTDEDKTTPAIQQLQAFVEHVNAFMRSGVLSYDQGRSLVSGAKDIINQMNSPARD